MEAEARAAPVARNSGCVVCDDRAAFGGNFNVERRAVFEATGDRGGERPIVVAAYEAVGADVVEDDVDRFVVRSGGNGVEVPPYRESVRGQDILSEKHEDLTIHRKCRSRRV